MKRFPNAESAREFLEEKRWNGHISCPHCGCSDIYHRTNRIGYYRCRKCHKEFTVRTKSIFEHSNIPLDKWIFAIYMILTARKGMSSLQMSKELSITQKSTWFMQHRIRTAMSHGKYADMLKGIVEVDETYIGGKEDNKHASKKLNAGRGAIGKTPRIRHKATERQGRFYGCSRYHKGKVTNHHRLNGRSWNYCQYR